MIRAAQPHNNTPAPAPFASPQAGYYCPQGSTSSQQQACGQGLNNRDQYYCPGGQGAPLDVNDLTTIVSPSVFFTTGGNRNTRTGASVCPAGYMCVNGVKTICSAGYYSTGGKAGCDGECEAGSFCPAGSQSGVAHQCYPIGQKPPASEGGIYFCEAKTSAPKAVRSGYYTVPEGCWENNNCQGELLADLNEYTVNYGIRVRRIEWGNPCASANGDGVTGTVHYSERVNKEALNAPQFSNLLGESITAQDNVNNRAVSNFDLVALASSGNSLECIAVNPFTLDGTNLMVDNRQAVPPTILLLLLSLQLHRTHPASTTPLRTTAS